MVGGTALRIIKNLRLAASLTVMSLCGSAILGPAHAQTGDGFTQLAQQHDAAYQAGNYAQAYEVSVRLLEFARASGGERTQGYLIASIINGADLVSLGRYDEAAAMLTRARAAALAGLGPQHQLTQFATQNLTGALVNAGRYSEAEPLLRENLAAMTAAMGEANPNTLKVLSTLASNLELQGRLDQAEPLHRKAMDIATQILNKRDPERIPYIANLGSVLSELGHSEESELLSRRALELAVTTLGDRHPTTLTALNNLAAGLDAQGRYGEGEVLYQRALATRVAVLGERHPDTLSSRNNLAQNLTAQGRFAEAEPLLRQSVALAGSGSSLTYALDASAALAMNLEAQGKLDEAEPLARKVVAMRTAQQGPDNIFTLSARETLAVILNRQRRLPEAEAELLDIAKRRTAVLGADSLPAIVSLANLSGVLLEQPARSPLAVVPARLAADGLRRRMAATGYNPRDAAELVREQASQRTVFERLADADWVAGIADPATLAAGRAEAFAALQDAMAGTTSRAVALTAARNSAANAGADLGDLARQREDLSDQAVSLEAQRTATFGASGPDVARKRNTLAAQIAGTLAQLAAIDMRLRRDAPAYFALTRPESVSIEDAQRLLGPDEAMLVIVPTEIGTHAVAISHDSFQWTRAPLKRSTINAAVQTLRAGLDPAALARLDVDFDRKQAFELYQALIAPASAVLAGKRHLFIAADGALASLPFGVLVTAEPAGDDGDAQAMRDTHWLGDSFALVQLPSLQSLKFLRSVRRPLAQTGSAESFIGYGDPALGGTAVTRGKGGVARVTAASVLAGEPTRSGSAIADIGKLRELASLPGTALELERIRAAVGAPASSLHLRAAATETAIKSADLATTRILAFATHGLLAGEVQGWIEPGLVLTPPAAATELDDGLLTTSEITGLKLNATLVILSACNSGGGGGDGTPALSGLARAFFYAGADALLVSHWAVYDDVAPRISTELIAARRADPKLSRAEALQRAVRAIRHDPADASLAFPSAWAPFVIVGDAAH